MQYTRITNQPEWQKLLGDLGCNELLQTWAWGEIKSRWGWEPKRYVWLDHDTPVAACQLLQRTERRLGISVSILYAPRGPWVDWENHTRASRVLADLQAIGKQHGALFVKIDPALVTGTGIPDTEDAHENNRTAALLTQMQSAGWRYSPFQIQFKNSVILDLDRPEEDVLKSFKQKTRYNIRLAGRKNVTVRNGHVSDLELLYILYKNTASRDGFIIRPREYYLDTWQTLLDANLAQPLIAEVDGEPIAAVFTTRCGDTATYMYGMSSGKHREKMPTYVLQWDAMRWAQSEGCTRYDFWGAPDVFDETDSMWGVWRFKQGFRGTLVRTAGAWDLPIRTVGYHLYVKVMSRLLKLMQSRYR